MVLQEMMRLEREEGRAEGRADGGLRARAGGCSGKDSLGGGLVCLEQLDQTGGCIRLCGIIYKEGILMVLTLSVCI